MQQLLQHVKYSDVAATLSSAIVVTKVCADWDKILGRLLQHDLATLIITARLRLLGPCRN